MCVQGHTCVHVETRSQSLVLFIRRYPLLGRGETERGAREKGESQIHCPDVCQRGQTLWPVNPGDPPAFASPVLGSQVCATRLCKWGLG